MHYDPLSSVNSRQQTAGKCTFNILALKLIFSTYRIGDSDASKQATNITADIVAVEPHSYANT